MANTLTISIAGFGFVGQAVYGSLNKQGRELCLIHDPPQGLNNFEEYLTNIIGPSKRYYYTYDEVNILFEVIDDGRGLYSDFDFIFGSDIK